MRTYGTLLVTGIVALVVGCGGSSGSKTSGSGRSGATGGQCPASSNGQTCTGEAAYETCVMGVCGTQYKACFGNNYASGNFTGGACADWVSCEMACPCDATATTCESTCSAQFLTTTAGQTCLSCLTTLETCVSGAACTQPVCTTTSTNTNTATLTNTNTATNTGTGTSCAALTACCATLTGAVATGCQAAVSSAAGVDATCASLLTSFKSGGYCP